MFNKSSHSATPHDPRLSMERQTRILSFLRNHPVGVLSMTTPENTAHGSVIYFAIGQDHTIGFVTKKLTRKYRNLTANNQVMLTCFEASTQTTVSIVGKAEEVHDDYELNEIAGAIMSASLKTTDSGMPPVTKLKAGAFTAFKIIPSNFYMAIYNKPGNSGYEEIFESVESFDLPAVNAQTS